MAQINPITTFLNKWNQRFANNTTGQISEVQMRGFVADIAATFAPLSTSNAVPLMPSNVLWVVTPTYTIAGTTLSESASQINDAGTIKNVPAQNIPVPYASAGKKRLDAIVLVYTGGLLYYVRIPGVEVDKFGIAAREALPANTLFVRDLDITENSITQAPTIPVKSVIFEGVEYFPNTDGQVIIGGGVPPVEADPTEPEIDDAANTAAFRPKAGATAADYEFEFTPAAPTASEFDDVNRTAAFMPTPGTNPADYEFQIEG